jgi:hypothetical protein
MIKRLVITALLCGSAAIAAPVFASSGYGPSPRYNPLVGAPSSQRGQSALTVRGEQSAWIAGTDNSTQSYGGVHDATSQSGARYVPDASIAPYAHH